MESPALACPKPQFRSKVGNGTSLLSDVDGRSTMMRRYKEILAQIVSDIGGDPSEAENIIARRACTLAVWCEQAAAAMANGAEIDIQQFTTATNALRRLLLDIGLERRAKDITPTLSQYLEAAERGSDATSTPKTSRAGFRGKRRRDDGPAPPSGTLG